MTGRKLSVPKPESSASKFVRPRSQQKSTKKQDANSTISSSERSGFRSTSSRNLNSTVRRNLDVTLVRAAAGCPQIKPKFETAGINNELESSIAYSEYLQAAMKRQIARKTTGEHRNILDNQLVLQSQNLSKLKQNHEEILMKIENLNLRSQVVEILDYMSDSITNMNAIFEKLDTKKSAVSLCDILTEESSSIGLNNIKPIETQEEYDNLIQSLSNLALSLEAVLNSERNFNWVTQLSEDIRKFNEVKNKVGDFQKIVNESKRKCAIALISNASDMFAKLGGYD